MDSTARDPHQGSDEEVNEGNEEGNKVGFQWIFHGTFIVPIGNPFSATTNAKVEDILFQQDSESTILLAPGIVLRRNHILAVDWKGRIVRFEPAASFFLQQHDISSQSSRYIPLQEYEFLCPGLIDLHLHAPQYAFAGTGTDRSLMGPDGWLETYTFPTEQSLRDLHKAQDVYHRVVQKTLQCGTTTVVYFATLDVEPTQCLVDICLKHGQRAWIGKVCMDRNAPTTYCHSVEQNLRDTQQFIDYVRNHPGNSSNLITPVITPRFIPTCSPALLKGLGQLAKEHQCPITSHISESVDEVEVTRQLDRQDYYGDDRNDHGHDSPNRTDAQIFASHGLLTNQCIMAHGVFVDDNDLDLLYAHGSAIAHCPLSNFYFAGGSFPCRHVLERGSNKVGLGSDIAGGYHALMFEACRMAVVASLSLEQQQQQQQQQNHPTDPTTIGCMSSASPSPSSIPLFSDKNHTTTNNDNLTHKLEWYHTLYMATLGGAEAMGLQNQIGTFHVGMEFDAIIISPASTIDIVPWRDKTIQDVIQKLWVLGDDRNITHVFVQGRQVKMPSSHSSR